MKIEKFDREAVKIIEKEISKAIEAIAKNYNLTYNSLSFSYLDSECKVRISLTTESAPKEKSDSSERQFRIYAFHWGLKPEWLGKDINVNGTTYVISGWDNRQRKNKVILKRKDDDKIFKSTPQSICIHMGFPKLYRKYTFSYED